jgi:hypothetical protein
MSQPISTQGGPSTITSSKTYVPVKGIFFPALQRSERSQSVSEQQTKAGEFQWVKGQLVFHQDGRIAEETRFDPTEADGDSPSYHTGYFPEQGKSSYISHKLAPNKGLGGTVEFLGEGEDIKDYDRPNTLCWTPIGEHVTITGPE